MSSIMKGKGSSDISVLPVRTGHKTITDQGLGGHWELRLHRDRDGSRFS